MKKIGLIIRREYLTRVRKKSFIIMTLIGPLLMAGLFIVPAWIAMNADDEQDILVIDDSYAFSEAFEDSEVLRFHYITEVLDSGITKVQSGDFDALLYIPPRMVAEDNGKGAKLIYQSQPGVNAINFIEKAIEGEIEEKRLAEAGIDPETLENAKVEVELNTSKLDDLGGESADNTEINMAIGMIAGVLIYMFIFLYGVQVMRGVIEEKTNRIIEVIVSSVKPFQLMMGKILGIALVSLTQLLLWVGLTMVLTTGASTALEYYMGEKGEVDRVEQMMGGNTGLSGSGQEIEVNQEAVDDMLSKFNEIPYVFIISCFLFYFLGGYLLYSALFAAVGSAVDNEADSQQFMLPITAPIIFSFVMAQAVIQNPDSSLSFYLSVIPFTSPIIMMVRIPFGVPVAELALSMTMLIIGFLATTWLAAKVYRIGILMYGKKPSFKEIWKWVRQS